MPRSGAVPRGAGHSAKKAEGRRRSAPTGRRADPLGVAGAAARFTPGAVVGRVQGVSSGMGRANRPFSGPAFPEITGRPAAPVVLVRPHHRAGCTHLLRLFRKGLVARGGVAPSKFAEEEGIGTGPDGVLLNGSRTVEFARAVARKRGSIIDKSWDKKKSDSSGLSKKS